MINVVHYLVLGKIKNQKAEGRKHYDLKRSHAGKTYRPQIYGLAVKLGYSSADLMLYAQTLGLNTWWIGAPSTERMRPATTVFSPEPISLSLLQPPVYPLAD